MDLRAHLQQDLENRYTLDRELGGGGMSRVFVAQDLALGRRVVVKVLPPEHAAGVSVERFKREIQLAARLQHPHIVPVLTAGEAGGLPYFTMPYVDGESLRARLERHGELSVGETVSMLREVAKALAYAHERGIVHRDIKPDNVLFADGTAMVTDFGIAKALAAARFPDGGADSGAETLTALGTTLGTPAYMAPEQAVADPQIDHRADLYALGVLAYEALAGQPPFVFRSAQQLVAAHATQTPTSILQHRPKTPAALAALVMRLLEKHPADRPQTVADVLHALDALDLPTRSGETATERATPKVRWAIGATVVVAALALLATLPRRAATPTDRQVVAVAPFRIAGADPDLHYLREGMLDLLAAKLGGETGVRAADVRTVLNAWKSTAGSTTADLSQADALQIAMRVQAGQLLLGDIVGTKNRLTISAKLLAAPSGRQIAATSIEGSSDSLAALVDHLAVKLLSLSAGEGDHRLSALTSTSLPALRAYLDGQAYYRRGHFDQALASFTRAAEIDSNFALAGLGLFEASGWSGGSAAARARGATLGGRVAWRGRDRLSRTDLALLHVRLGRRFPAPWTHADRLSSAEELSALAPDSPEAWFELGDAYYHGGAMLGIDESATRALQAFIRAIELDSSFVPALDHLPTLYRLLGDTASVRRSTALLLARDTLASGRAGFVRWYAAVATGDSAMLRELRAGMSRMDSRSLVLILQQGPPEGLPIEDVQRAADILVSRALTDPQRNTAFGRAYWLAVDRGRPALALRLAARMKMPPVEGAVHSALDAALWDADSSAGAEGAALLRGQIDAPLPDSSGARRRRADELYVVAQYDLSQRRTEVAKRVIPLLRNFRAPADSSWMADTPRNLALLLDAQVAALERRRDALPLLSALDSILRTGPRNFMFALPGNLVAARLWEASGDVRRALQAIRRRDFGTVIVPYGSTYAREEARLAVVAGEREGAIRAYRRYLAMRDSTEFIFAQDTRRARAELSRLEGMASGR